MKPLRLILISFFVIQLSFLGSCDFKNASSNLQSHSQELEEESLIEAVFDLPDIYQRDTLNIILTYSSSSYFIYRGAPMGYEYELVNRLADHLGVHMQIIVAENMDEMFDMLLRGEGDIIAHAMTVTKARKELIDFTLPHNQTQQVLVQRKPDSWRKMKLHEIDRSLIRSPLDLIGKTVSVRKESSYYDRLTNLSEEIGGDIEIELVSGEMTTDELIEKVAFGDIEYTVADQNIALINHTYFDQLDIQTSVSLMQQLAWAVRKSSPQLLEKINTWITDNRKETEYHVIYNKYFKNKRAFRSRMKSDYFSRTGGKLSPYDKDIQLYADSLLNWDWRLLAALMFQESRFDPQTTSWAGAQGLMQVMPATGASFGVNDLFDPEENMRAGTAYLKRLQGMWEGIPDTLDRMKFILASYNAGPGHVMDAQRIAEKLGKDPKIWDENVAEGILLKSRPEYFNDDLVKYGYCRGREPYEYVQEIFGRYEEYKLFLN